MWNKVRFKVILIVLCLLFDLIGQYVWQAHISLTICSLVVLMLQLELRQKVILIACLGVFSGWWFGYASISVLSGLVVWCLYTYLNNRVPKLLLGILLSSGFVSTLVLSLVIWQNQLPLLDAVGWFSAVYFIFIVVYRPVGVNQMRYAI